MLKILIKTLFVLVLALLLLLSCWYVIKFTKMEVVLIDGDQNGIISAKKYIHKERYFAESEYIHIPKSYKVVTYIYDVRTENIEADYIKTINSIGIERFNGKFTFHINKKKLKFNDEIQQENYIFIKGVKSGLMSTLVIKIGDDNQMGPVIESSN